MVIRLFDLFSAVLALTILSPLLFCVIFLLRVTGEGEVFFLQERVGKNGKLFSLWKFVTMLKDSPSMKGGTITTRTDARILPLGRFLRSTKINELAQLLNVLKGDMSLVGPRPLTEETFNMYDSETKKIICETRPGLSGIGSIIFRNEENFLDRRTWSKIQNVKYSGIYSLCPTLQSR